MPFIHDRGYDWPYDVYDSSDDEYDSPYDDQYDDDQSDDEDYDQWDDEYYESTIEVIPQEDPLNRNLRLINIDLGPAVSAAVESGSEIHIIVEEPVEGDDSVAVPWELLDGWFYRVGNSYVISLLVEDRADFDLDAEYMLRYYYGIRRNTGRSFSFLFTMDPLLIVVLD
ncbi:hypothetical protein THAR02_03310 [Trichoderma harzianum]|uniref:Uncharacterized protein n=1 Tax=Trichoderma harzianum TaxID=5544 RepID=A0A0F9XJL5_TRIHA|nr:hypothetical protein THAR02_03310 [Trichoderma harzianum]